VVEVIGCQIEKGTKVENERREVREEMNCSMCGGCGVSSGCFDRPLNQKKEKKRV
jgi:hypothetical protein